MQVFFFFLNCTVPFIYLKNEAIMQLCNYVEIASICRNSYSILESGKIKCAVFSSNS
jgi:hypothetical protein